MRKTIDSLNDAKSLGAKQSTSGEGKQQAPHVETPDRRYGLIALVFGHESEVHSSRPGMARSERGDQGRAAQFSGHERKSTLKG